MVWALVRVGGLRRVMGGWLVGLTTAVFIPKDKYFL